MFLLFNVQEHIENWWRSLIHTCYLDCLLVWWEFWTSDQRCQRGDVSGNWEDEADKGAGGKGGFLHVGLSLFEDCSYFWMGLGLKLFSRHLSILFLKERHKITSKLWERWAFTCGTAIGWYVLPTVSPTLSWWHFLLTRELLFCPYQVLWSCLARNSENLVLFI